MLQAEAQLDPNHFLHMQPRREPQTNLDADWENSMSSQGGLSPNEEDHVNHMLIKFSQDVLGCLDPQHLLPINAHYPPTFVNALQSITMDQY